MKPATPGQQRGAVTLMGALFLIIVIIVLLNAVQRMAASDITDTALHNESVEALFIAESGLERASWRYANGTACAALAGESANTGRGAFQVISAALNGSLCVVRVRGDVITTTAANTVSRTIDGSLTAGGGGSNSWAVGEDESGEMIIHWEGSSWSRSGPYGRIPDKKVYVIHCVSDND